MKKAVKVIEFQRGDEVKWGYDFSVIMHYGTVLMVRDKSCLIKVVNGITGEIEKVVIAKNILNFN